MNGAALVCGALLTGVLAVSTANAFARQPALWCVRVSVQEPSVEGPSGEPLSTEPHFTEEGARAQRREAWTELLELDLAHELLADRASWPGGEDALAQDGPATALVARALAASGRLQEARDLLGHARPADPQRANIELGVAELDLADDLLAEVSTRLCDESGALLPAFDALPGARYVLGRARVRAGDAASARGPLEALVTRWPRHADAPSAWYMLAQEALARRDVERARECRANGDELGRWHAYYRTRRLQRRANPDAPEPRIGIAQLWIAAQDWDRARAELQPVLAQHPEACAAWTTLGELERKQAHPKAARAAYQRATDCDPTDSLARFNLALLLLDAGERAAATTHLESLCNSPAAGDARFLRAHLELARLLLARGDLAAANARHAHYRDLGGTEPLETE